MNYEKKFNSYQNALNKADVESPSLLLGIAGCYIHPEPPITIEEAENLVRKSLEIQTSIEGVVLMRGICAQKNDKKQFDYWNSRLEEVEKKNLYVKNDWPASLNS